jgi:primosomal protein N' (replication factor Y)
VLDADVGLHLPDFRAAERTYQLLVQVAGRSGRGVKAGEVWVQTCTPEHPAIAAAVLHDERAFLDHELRQRREARYPPYVRLVSLGFAGRDEASVERAAHEAAEGLRGATSAEAAELTLGLPDVTDDGFANTPLGEISAGSGERPERSSATPQVAIADGDADESEEPELQVLGPAPHAFARLRGLHRWHVLLKSRRAALVREAAARALAAFESAAARKGVRMTVDVDPLDVL